jgi:hypothetical protein
LRASREGVPPPVQATVDTVTDDIADRRYDKVYDEAAEEWRKAYSAEQSNAVFDTLSTKLGGVRGRAFHSATEQQNSGGPVPGHSFVISYDSTFERGEGMETFTLLERDGQWLLAGYFVSSTALK